MLTPQVAALRAGAACLLLVLPSQVAPAQIERYRVPAGEERVTSCVREEYRESIGLDSTLVEPCVISADPTGDTVIYVPEPIWPWALLAGSALLIALSWRRG